MLAYRQAFASFSVKKSLTLFKHKWGAMRPTSEYCFQADYSWAILTSSKLSPNEIDVTL